jgi:hypothetical protein
MKVKGGGNENGNEIKPSCIDTKSVNVYFSILAQRCYHCLYLFDNKYVLPSLSSELRLDVYSAFFDKFIAFS